MFYEFTIELWWKFSRDSIKITTHNVSRCPLTGNLWILDNIACPDHPSWVTWGLGKLDIEIYLQGGPVVNKILEQTLWKSNFQLNPFCFRSGWLGLSFSDVGSLCRSTRAGLLLHLLRIDLENFLEMGQRPVAESGKKRRMVGGCSLLARVGSTWNEQERQLQLLVRPRHLQTGIRCKWSRCRTGRLLVATLDFHFNIQRTEKDSIAYRW